MDDGFARFADGRSPRFSPAVWTGRTMSVNLRTTNSLCVIDLRFAAPGTPVTVLWGRPGTAQREIRAVVTALPFMPDHRRAPLP